MATKNLLNVDWDACEDDFYDEFIEEETTRKLRMKSKDRDFSGSKSSKKNSLSNKIIASRNEYEEDIPVSDNQYNTYHDQEPFKKKDLPAYNVDRKASNQINNKQTKDSQKTTEISQKTLKNSENSPKKPIILGENTKDVKNNKIDFDRLAGIEKVDGEYKGNQTFGIKFIFTGTKGLFRIAWYGRNMFERDHAFQEYYNFWKSLGY